MQCWWCLNHPGLLFQNQIWTYLEIFGTPYFVDQEITWSVDQRGAQWHPAGRLPPVVSVERQERMLHWEIACLISHAPYLPLSLKSDNSYGNWFSNWSSKAFLKNCKSGQLWFWCVHRHRRQFGRRSSTDSILSKHTMKDSLPQFNHICLQNRKCQKC